MTALHPKPPEAVRFVPQMSVEKRLELLCRLPDERETSAIMKRRVAIMCFFADADGKVYVTDEQIEAAAHHMGRIFGP